MTSERDTVAGIVLAGGRSTRMGSPKAGLEWHGSTLVRHVAGLVARVVDGPVVVVGGPGQALPALPEAFEVAADPAEGQGPMQGLATGLSALEGRADVAFVASTDLPFLHPDYVRCVLSALDAGHDAAVPTVDGHHQPFAAAYRVALAPLVRELVAAGRLKPAHLYERCRVRRLAEEEVAVPGAVDNLNDPAAYAEARARPAPEVVVAGRGRVRAATLGEAAAAAGLPLGPRDPHRPLVAGDVVDLG